MTLEATDRGADSDNVEEGESETNYSGRTNHFEAER